MEDASKVRERGKPYFYEVNSETLVILIHGFTGSPDDMRELAKYLFSQNISVKVPRLAGHASYWTELEKTSFYDWWKSVEDEVIEASGKYQKIFLIGYSFGGNLALDLAARYGDKITGVVTLGASVFLRKEIMIRIFLPFFHHLFKKYRKRYISNENLFEYEDSGCYACVPTKSIYDFYKFIKMFTKRELHKVKVPTLIIHSRDDAITHPLSSQFIFDRIGSAKKELVMLDELNHNPLASKRRDMIFGRIIRFINSL